MKQKLVRLICLFLATILLLGFSIPVAPAAAATAAASTPFTDVPQDSWFHDAIAWAYNGNITTGTSPRTFSPHRNVTRGEFVTFLHRIEGTPPVSNTIRFNDVANSEQYFFNAVNWAFSNQLVTGIGDGLFAPDRNITREEMAVILFRLAGYHNRNISAPYTALNNFDDRQNVSGWALEGMRWAANADIIRGNDQGRVNPGDRATRAEAIVVLHRYVLELPGLPQPPASGFTHGSVFNGALIGGPASTTANDQLIWNFFRNRGLNTFAAAGIMGNLFSESNMRPTIVERARWHVIRDNHGMPGLDERPAHINLLMDEWYTNAINSGAITRAAFQDGVGYGLSQWTFWSRKAALHDFIWDFHAERGMPFNIGCLDAQLHYFWHELTTDFRTTVFLPLQNVNCVFEASNIVLTRFMRPADQGLSVQGRRAGYSLGYFNRYT
ncbi:MAG: phage tail tip lysozyme [Oscillospiraceae bacterium]|nr:phage tail tip lysozyme [Oscillospiraceae bacterium]